MKLQTSNGVLLDTYYRSKEGECGSNKTVIKAQKLGISPYDGDETLYYLFKHLALPGIAVGLLILLMIFFRIFNNFFIDSVSYILLILAAIFLISVGRELIRGWKYKIKKGVIYLPGPYVINREAAIFTHHINEITKTEYKLGFVGDIMMLKKFDLTFHPDIKVFFNDVDLIIGNLEGIVTDQSCPITKQAHPRSILTQLESLLSGNTKWLLCLSNNHSEDFSNIQFNHSLHRIQRRSKFDVFGREDVSFIHNKNNDINIFSATQWSNQKTWNYTLKYDKSNINPNSESNIRPNIKPDIKPKSDHFDNNKFNILIPHWGFENEKYVRTRFQSDAKALLTGNPQRYSRIQKYIRKKFKRVIKPDPEQKWDIIFAHHPHVLQPIMKVPDIIKDDNGKDIKYNKLAVFSAGNFTSGVNIIRQKKHISGIIMKCYIGPLKGHEEKLVIGKMEWRRTKNYKIRVGNTRTKRVCVDSEKYRTYNKTFLITGMSYFILFLTVYFIFVFT